MRPKVYATRRIPSPGIELISETCDVTVNEGIEPLDTKELLEGVREWMDSSAYRETGSTRRIFEGPSLKVVSTCSVGYEHIDVAEATKRGIYVGYTPEVLTDATADLAFALLDAGRRTAEATGMCGRANGRVGSTSCSCSGRPVWEATFGIIGFGRIGRAMALRAGGFNMKVIYSDLYRATAEEEQGSAWRSATWTTSLRNRIIVSLHVPYSKATHHLIDERTLKAMKKTPYW